MSTTRRNKISRRKNGIGADPRLHWGEKIFELIRAKEEGGNNGSEEKYKRYVLYGFPPNRYVRYVRAN